MKKIRWIVISMMILLFSMILYFTVRGFYFRHRITSYTSEINAINHNCSKYIVQQNNQKTLDKNTLLKNISSDTLERLSFCKYNVSKLKFPNKYSSMKNTLLQSIDYSYAIYVESKNICSGESIDNLKISVEKINQTKQKLCDAYTLLDDKGIFSLGDMKCINVFIDACYNYVNCESQRLRASEIHSAKKQAFTNSITNIYYELRTLISNNNYAKTALRLMDAKKDLSPILLSIQDQKLSLSKLKIKLSSLSIPEGLNSYFYSVQSMVQSYNLYLEKLSSHITAENIQYKNTGRRDMRLEAQYENLAEELSSMKSTVEDFSRNIDKLLTQ